jgi:hypothetical protein
MWRIDMGPNSTNTSSSSPGAACIAFGHSDNEAAYDIDCDGKGEVILKVGNGTIFGDGKVLNASTNKDDAWITAIDGVTGAEKGTRCIVPDDLKATSNITGHFGICYFDGVHPSLMFKGKAGGTRAMMDMAFDCSDKCVWSLRWKAVCSPIQDYANDHQIRCLDINDDGLDEEVNGGYCRTGDGKVLWNMTSQGISHGDRFHIGKFDPARPGLQGFCIGQNSAYDLAFYDPKDGTVLRKVGTMKTDVSRGNCGDVDPSSPGYECWSAPNGMYNVDGSKQLKPGNNKVGTELLAYDPPVNFRMWWDGDVLSENLDGNIITKYAYPGIPSGAFTQVTLPGIYAFGFRPPLYGDMFGDWREELMMEQSGGAALRVYTTTIPTEKRIYCLMHDPEYRNGMVEKGYIQSRFVDFYLGDGMTDPPKPNMTYPGVVSVLPGPDTRRTGRVLASSEGASMMVMAGKSFTLPGVSAGAARSMSVYTCTGKLVARAPVSGNNVNLEKQFGLSNSMYIVKISQKGGI